jgi:hypothetical protein
MSERRRAKHLLPHDFRSDQLTDGLPHRISPRPTAKMEIAVQQATEATRRSTRIAKRCIFLAPLLPA